MSRDRRTYLGGVDAGAILGLDPWASPYAVWLAKTSPEPEPEQGCGEWWQGAPSEAAWWGTRSERAILDAYTLRTGRKVRPGELVASITEHPELAGTPDGFPEPEGLVEAKNVGHVTCTECKAQPLIPASRVTITPDTYTFTCPSCGAHVAKPAVPRTIDLLREIGCAAWCDELDDPARRDATLAPLTEGRIDRWAAILRDPTLFEQFLILEGLAA